MQVCSGPHLGAVVAHRAIPASYQPAQQRAGPDVALQQDKAIELVIAERHQAVLQLKMQLHHVVWLVVKPLNLVVRYKMQTPKYIDIRVAAAIHTRALLVMHNQVSFVTLTLINQCCTSLQQLY